MPLTRFAGVAATTLIVAQIVIRAWMVARGDFYWDDLVLIGRASSHPILSWDYLGYDHDGHFMPGAFLVAGITTLIAPVQWWLPAATLVVLQALASVAVWRMIRAIAPAATVGALAALAFYLFVPMTVPSYVWWAAGLNALPMQIGMAVVIADVVLLVRAGKRSASSRRRLTVGAVVAFVVALLFFEKSLFIAPVAFAAAVLSLYGEGARSPVAAAWRRAQTLWLWLAGVFVVWGGVYLSVSSSTSGPHDAAQTAQLVWRSVNQGVVPSLVGGPWVWERWTPGPPFGDPALWMIVAGWLVLIAAVVWTVLRRRGAAVIWACALLYVVAAQVPVMWNRSGHTTGLVLAQSLRYLPDAALVLAVAMALLVAARPRGARVVEPGAGQKAVDGEPVERAQDVPTGPYGDGLLFQGRRAQGWRDAERAESGRSGPQHTEAAVVAAASQTPVPDAPVAESGEAVSDPAPAEGGVLRGLALVGAAAVLVSALVSTSAFTTSWHDDPTGSYLATARDALSGHPDLVMFDQPVPLEVLLPVAYPYNQISNVFGRVPDRPKFGTVTDELVVLDPQGHLVPGAVTPVREVAESGGSCGRPRLDEPTRLRLSGPLIQWQWTVSLSYCADMDGEIAVRLAGGDEVRVPVRSGLHPVYFQVSGGGDALDVRPVTPGLKLHTGEGRVGQPGVASLVAGG
ncbi:MAG: hypothetical protein QM658_08185 [Gordonia sp. (in: high G+C Gram-positive bacteria)]